MNTLDVLLPAIALYNQQYDLLRFIAYVAVMASAAMALISLHLILEGHDSLRPLSIPILIINFIQLGLNVLRYVFTPDVKPAYLIFDLIFFAGMAIFSLFMLAHIGLLGPFRRQSRTTLTGTEPRPGRRIEAFVDK